MVLESKIFTRRWVIFFSYSYYGSHTYGQNANSGQTGSTYETIDSRQGVMDLRPTYNTGNADDYRS